MATDPQILVLLFKAAIILCAPWRQERPCNNRDATERHGPSLASQVDERRCEPPALSASPGSVTVEIRGWKETWHIFPRLHLLRQEHTHALLRSGQGGRGCWQPLEWRLTATDKNLNSSQVLKEPVETVAPKERSDLFALARSTPDARGWQAWWGWLGNPEGNEGSPEGVALAQAKFWPKGKWVYETGAEKGFFPGLD